MILIFVVEKNLEELHQAYVQFATEECSQNLVQVFRDYNDWIEQRSKLVQQFQSIQQSYEKQCEDIMNYVEMIDDLRTVVYKNIRKLSENSSNTPAAMNEYLSVPSPAIQSQVFQLAEDDSAHQTPMSSGGEEEDVEESSNPNPENKTFMKKICGTTRRTILQAEEGFIKLDHVIRQLRTSIQKK